MRIFIYAGVYRDGVHNHERGGALETLYGWYTRIPCTITRNRRENRTLMRPLFCAVSHAMMGVLLPHCSRRARARNV